MLRLRTLLFVCFGGVVLIPVLILVLWISDWAIKKEYDDVEGKHLLVAKNLTSALSRYAIDVKEAFVLAQRQITNGEAQPVPELAQLFRSLHFARIYSQNAQGVVHIYYQQPTQTSMVTHGDTLQLANIELTASEVAFLPVKLLNGRPVLPLVSADEQQWIIAELDTAYITQLQKQISFGRKGHAAIVDQQGNLLAHPKPDWVAEAKNLSQLDPVKRMMNLEQGVSFFYSPALDAQMVAGFSAVPETGWGVMVPQPLSELHGYAAALVRITMIVSALGIGLSLFIAWLLSGFISRPVGEVARIARLIAGHKANVDKVASPSPATDEMSDLVDSFNRMTSEVTSKTRELAFLANHDPLTQLPNRTYLKTALVEQLSAAQQAHMHFALLFIDLDEFKEVNDTLGHGYGDLLLQEVALRIQQQVGDQGIVSRQGGDEFAILLAPNLEAGTAERLSHDIIESIHLPFAIEGDQLFISASIGIAHYPQDGQDLIGLLCAADLAMYAAKADDSCHYRGFSQELQQTLSERKQLEKALRKALNQGGFVLYYQPRIEPKSGQVTAFEALVRWQHPTRGLILPSGFIEVAERTGDILALGRWVIAQAIADVARWREQGLGEVNVSINLSERQFHAPELIRDIEILCEDHQVKPSQIEFEVTESLAMKKPAKAVSVLLHLKARGFSVAIDDFGTGYSSLARLKQLPVDKVKIDKSFVQGIGPKEGVSTKDAAIVEHILKLAQGLGMSVVAEGVETIEQLRFLNAIGCTEVQGFLYSQAVTWQQASQLLTETPLVPLARPELDT